MEYRVFGKTVVARIDRGEEILASITTLCNAEKIRLGSVSGIGFSQERWQKHMRPGHWNDPDILQIGKLGKPNQPNTTFVQAVRCKPVHGQL